MLIFDVSRYMTTYVNHAVANNTICLRMLYRSNLSYTMLVVLTVCHAQKTFYECIYDPPTGYI